ncbi:MAG: aminotransferase class I/II-fold pyridoxal phosphate-dependent enzyme [Ruminococcaceae bacterium]|nr:aminotransferase class I/II-fold pyridoxal phosphate-dependent enzyme [Oscillospiraceae bacterium]
MLSFESDYILGAHEKILDALVRTNGEQLSGYGNDPHTENACRLIKNACHAPEADVFLLMGGTQVNKTVIATLLKPYEGVIAPTTGHVSLHEVGAIEYTGHKVIELPQHDGKLSPSEVREYMNTFYGDENNGMMVVPGMIYISHPTEYGTLYTLSELRELRAIADEYGMRLFMDGARLGYGLMSKNTDVTLPDIAQLCHVFYIGGTKVGALCGEAVVFAKGVAPTRFHSLMKQHGALTAKGRLLGVQFETLFTDGLYFDISRNAIDRAEELKSLLLSCGYELFIASPTNQQFVVLTDAEMGRIKDKCRFSFWERIDSERCVVRFATSYATTSEDIAALARILKGC